MASTPHNHLASPPIDPTKLAIGTLSPQGTLSPAATPTSLTSPAGTPLTFPLSPSICEEPEAEVTSLSFGKGRECKG